jgi:hypothetical protein
MIPIHKSRTIRFYPLPLPGEFVCRLMRPTCLVKHHPSVPVLEQYHKEGLPVDCGPPWSNEAVHAALKIGNRVSAMKPEAITTIKDAVDSFNYSHSRNPSCARTDARTNPNAQRATQLRSVLARVYSVSRQNLNTNTVP